MNVAFGMKKQYTSILSHICNVWYAARFSAYFHMECAPFAHNQTYSRRCCTSCMCFANCFVEEACKRVTYYSIVCDRLRVRQIACANGCFCICMHIVCVALRSTCVQVCAWLHTGLHVCRCDCVCVCECVWFAMNFLCTNAWVGGGRPAFYVGKIILPVDEALHAGQVEALIHIGGMLHPLPHLIPEAKCKCIA